MSADFLRTYRVGQIIDEFSPDSKRRHPDRLHIAYVGARDTGISTFLRAVTGSALPSSSPPLPLGIASARWTDARLWELTPQITLVQLGAITFNTIAVPREVRMLFRLFAGLVELWDGWRPLGRRRIDMVVFCVHALAPQDEINGLRSVIVQARALGLPFGLHMMQADRIPGAFPHAPAAPPMRALPTPVLSTDLPRPPDMVARLTSDAPYFPALQVLGGRGVQQLRHEHLVEQLAAVVAIVKDTDRFLSVDLTADTVDLERRNMEEEDDFI